MKIKRLCVLAVLLTSSLAGAASNSASKSEDKYSSFHRSPDMIRLRIDGDKEVGCRQHIVMI
ncbi:hypothetical protein [Wolbachia endosymbiont (group A) of Aleiodes leptofemur]|uniref:hypothetical protein n=1 Tax=Wolbachia endosymbiont (group A) of Aleiodes leptofemur TaxID=3077919 RepID=UPI003340212C